jgi:hypothetical protein
MLAFLNVILFNLSKRGKGRLHLRFGCAVWMCVSLSHAFSMSFSMSKTNIDIENACDGRTHIQTAHRFDVQRTVCSIEMQIQCAVK